jgi:glyoxylase-like metal-dependent hydrolase (beta-lactamase superfamily II)
MAEHDPIDAAERLGDLLQGAGHHLDPGVEQRHAAAESAQSLRPYHRLDRMAPHARLAYARLLPLWDGGALTVAGTVDEGDDISGFRVIHLPGHAPGLIALLRERDGLALTSDAFYTLDPQTVLHGPPKVPHPAFNEDGWRARESLRKLAEIGPSAAWPGHARPVTGDVPAQLRRAAADF